MEYKEIIRKEDLTEPYSSLSYVLSIEDILKVESVYAGKQVFFRKWINLKRHPELLELLGKEKTKEVLKILGGSDIYFPSIKRNCLERIRKEIRAEFTGHNYAELARRYNYTERSIRSIVERNEKKKDKKKEMQGQLSLFDT